MKDIEAELEQYAFWAMSDYPNDLVSQARIEIARLRAALESLTEDPPATLDEPDPDWEVIIKMRNIAREALGLPHGPTQ